MASLQALGQYHSVTDAPIHMNPHLSLHDSSLAGRASVSVVIPVFNGMPHLPNQLEALARQEAPITWEVIVVDNGSDDGSLAAVQAFGTRLPNLRILNECRRGKPHALNRGIDSATGELLVFLDQDDEITAGYLHAMAKGLAEFDLVGASVDFDSMNPTWARYQGGQTTGLARRRGGLPWSSGAALGVRTEVARQIRFRPDNGISDDIDFCWRAQLVGFSLGFVPEAVLRYRQRATALGAFRQGYGYGLSEVLTYINYRDQGHPRPGIRVVLWTVKSLLLLLCRVDLKANRLKFSYWSGIVSGNVLGSIRWRVLYL